MKCFSLIIFVIYIVTSEALNLDRVREHQIRTNNVYSEENSFADIVTDIVLKQLSMYLKEKNETSITIPPVYTQYGDISFRTSDGTFSNPVTIERRGESHFRRMDSKLIVSVDVGFSLMDVHFDSYTVSFLSLLDETGSVDIRIGKNSLFLEITVAFVPKCTISLTNVEMKEFSEISVDVKGLSILDYFVDYIVSWVLQSFRTSITDIIEDVVKNKLQEELKHTSLCKYKLNKT